MSETVFYRYKFKRRTTAGWASNNEVLFEGEPGIEVLADGSEKIKYGDGTKTWAQLSYAAGGGGVGPAGPTGPAGPAGAAGAAATIAVGTVTTGAAGSAAAINNAGTNSAAVFDFTIPRGDTGATGPQGPTGLTGAAGPAGADGKTVLSGSGAPASGLGINGDFYIDTAASKLYGPKTGGAWGSGVSLVGPQGATGVTGATGPQGPQGPQGPAGTAGATGATGATGAAGADGKTILNGSGAPSAGLGVNGDFYLDTAASRFYGPKTAGEWGSGVLLIGPQGPQGATGATGATGPQGQAGVVTAVAPVTYNPATQAVGMSMTAGRVLIGPETGTGAPREATLSPDLIIEGTVIRALRDILIPLSDEATALSTGVRLTVPYWPKAMALTELPIWMVGTAPTGAALQLDIRVGGTSIFSTLPTIAAGSTSSVGGTSAVFATAFVSGGQQIAAGASVTFHVLQIGGTVAGAGLKVSLATRRAS